tara:strand:- start:277 stop:801 length:525 start_codon:yes stop_codon:yes gene_type:complete
MVNDYHLPRLKNRDDERDYFVQFTRMTADPVGTWTFRGPVWSEPKKHVDKEMKATLKDDISSFYEWMCSVGNLLPVGDWDYLHRVRTEIIGYGYDVPRTSSTWREQLVIIPPGLAIEIIKDFNHPLRTHLAVNFLRRNNIKDVRTVEDQKVFRRNFNTWANKIFGLNVSTVADK